MIVVAGEFRLPPEHMAAAREAMERVVLATRGEAGCIAYSYAEDVLEPGLIRVFEQWDSSAALDAHFATAHMSEWKREREALGLTERRIAKCEAGAQTPI